MLGNKPSSSTGLIAPGTTSVHDWGPAAADLPSRAAEGNALPRTYVPTAVERFGRRIKLEYIGMISVYTVVGVLVFGNAGWPGALVCAVGAFLVFLGIKKKTRDHLSGSLLLFASTLLARDVVIDAGWSVPYLGFASCVCAMEGYLEKRQEQSLALPLIFLLWTFVDLSWVPALGFTGAYLLYPWTPRPGLRKRLAWLVLLSAALAVTATALGIGYHPLGIGASSMRLALSADQRLLLASMGVPTLLCLFAYWRRLIPTHKVNTLAFALLAPFDQRFLAMFGMVAAITLSATAFRHSVDIPRLRPYLKHAEWFYFWIVFGLALWAVLSA